MKEGDYFIKIYEPKYVIGKIVGLGESDFFGKKFKIKVFINKGMDAKNGTYGENSMLLAGAFLFPNEHELMTAIFQYPDTFLGYRIT